MNFMCKIAKIKYNDVSNGPGIRTAVYVQGCPHHCKGCFNPETWSFTKGGRHLTMEDRINFVESIKNHRDLSLLGGEPLSPRNYDLTEELLVNAHDARADVNVWLWTGYTMEHLLRDSEHNSQLQRILSLVDVVVDGKFEEDLKDLTLAWRGSSNQRLIDVKKSLKEKTIILFDI